MTTKTPLVISKGSRYKNNDTNEIVIVFFVDNTRGLVRYSPETLASGREFSADLEDFMKNFTDAGEAPVQKTPAA